MVEETREEPESEPDGHPGEAGPSAPIRVLIADDHPVVRDGLRHALAAPDVEVVGEAATGKEALAAAHLLNPDILVLDIRMPELDGLATLRAVKKTCPRTAVIIFTSYEDAEYLREAVLGGAAGYVLKATGGQELLATVRRVADGDSVIDPDMLALVLGEPLRREAAAKKFMNGETPDLTKREMQILRCIRSGLRNAEIASLFHLSNNTVKVHCHRLYGKLGVTDRTQALLWADRHGVEPTQ
jgi:DNA-binding NarL/FixJ family response regulator